MTAIGRNVANNMLYTCTALLFYIAFSISPVVYGGVASIKPQENLSPKIDSSSMASEARGSIDRFDTISNLLPHPSNFLLDNIVSTAGTAGITMSVNLTRQHDGDIFWTNGASSCNADTCVGLSSGTASWLGKGVNKIGSLVDNTGGSKSQLELLVRQTQPKLKEKSASSGSAATAANANGESCQCRCLPYLNTYREDLGICVDDIHECTLSPFISGSSSEKIPFVFLPLRGQIIYPSREISFADIRTPVCAVTGAQYLTANGWSDLRNPIDTDYPFRMFRDEGRTFLQWLGEADLRHKMQGRLIVVHLVCRDMTLSLNATATNEQLVPPKNVFSPCVAFRVNGSPVKYANNVSEVLFQAEATTTLAATSDGMSTKEYIVIGVCSLLLGLIYVSSVFLYLHMKKRKNNEQTHSRNSLDDINNEINYPKNDQVTFGAPFTRSGSLYSAGSITTSNEPRSRASLSSLKEEMGIVKNNPLLQHFPQLNDHHSGFTSDISNSNSECEMDGNGGNVSGYHDKHKQMQTNALIHPQMNMMLNSNSPKGSQNSSGNGAPSQSNKEDDNADLSNNGQAKECLPSENVAIIEEMMTEEKLESLRAMVNANIRKKLYFNPAYFEPHLLAQPPPAALEFLQKIREVIAIAKYKMATKRYQPSLTLIPEEGTPRSNTPSVYGSQLHTSSECHGCATNRCSGHVKNCGDKRNSIEKWLETVQSTEDSRTGAAETSAADSKSNDKETQSPSGSKTAENVKQSINNTGATLTGKRITPPKQKPPPPPIHKAVVTTGLHKTPLGNRSKHIGEENLYNIQTTSTSSAALYQKSRHNVNVAQHNLDTYTALTASAHMYGYAETGSEIYNNPKFTLLDSPAASQRSRSSSQRSKNSHKRLDTLDHYAAASTPTSLSSTERQHYNMLRTMEQMSDQLDAGTLERIRQEYTATLRSNGSFSLDIPTPDYDSTMEKKIKDIYNNTQSSGPSVPTPDYSSLSRKSLKQYQPDSPIYRRKSPQYLIVDYETDSLERLEATKRKSSQSSSSPSSDVSSQLSPSLSTALPLEEELEISHTVYQGEGFSTKSVGSQKKNVIRTLDSSSLKKDMAARIKYDTPFRGSMTIEVEHEPPSDLERSTDSDQYEPDTLDRKPKKQSFCDVTNWSKTELKRADDHLNSPPQSLPDMSRRLTKLEAQNSFRLKPSDTPTISNCRRQKTKDPAYESQVELRRPCGNEDLEVSDKDTKVSNLRDIYQSLLVRQNSDCSCKCGGQATSMFLQEKLEDLSDKGRILTLEAKHSRRQRTSLPPTPPPVVEISNESSNKCTIKINTPKSIRNNVPADKRPTEYVEPRIHKIANKVDSDNKPPAKYLQSPRQVRSESSTPPSRVKRSLSQSPQTPPPPPPPTSASTTLNSRTSRASSGTQQQYRPHSHTEEETMSNHSESTEVTGVSGTMTNSEFGGTIDKKSPAAKSDHKSDKTLEKPKKDKDFLKTDFTEAHQAAKKLKENDFGAIFNTHINGLRNDYSLNKYLNRRKSQERADDQTAEGLNLNLELQLENNNNLKLINETDPNKLDVVSLSSRSNRSSSRLSDRTKEMYRNAGVPVGIAYPQRNNNNINNNSATVAPTHNPTPPVNNTVVTPTPPSNNVQTVYRCEIEPVQLTHGMQIAMGLKDRPKKAKDIKNAWKKFVSMAASKFSPTHSPAPPFDKKATTLLEVLERDEGISSLIEDHPQVSTPKSSYSAPASQNYYEQRFGPRPQEMDSGYMSADSGEAHKRTFYDRYNFKMMSERDHIIRVSTIEDNSDGDSTLTDRHIGQEASARRGSILDTNRFEDFEHINEQQQKQQQLGTPMAKPVQVQDEASDNDSDKTLTRSNTQRRSPTSQSSSSTTFTSDEDEEEQITTSYGSSETDGETNADDMWESGAESVETHSVLYKNVRKSLER